jgi:hypothetical protein
MGHSPCIYCSRRVIDDSYAQTFAISRGLEPLTKYPGRATARWKMRCVKCARVSTASWTTLNMKRKNAGCSSCTEHGFKSLEPAYFYIISHKLKGAHKVGIGNTNAKRLEKHLANGWNIYRVVAFSKGSTAHSLEQKMLDWFRDVKNIGPAFRRGDGWTETVPADEISLSLIWRQARLFGADKGKLTPSNKFARF